jgi:hypothetical protein
LCELDYSLYLNTSIQLLLGFFYLVVIYELYGFSPFLSFLFFPSYFSRVVSVITFEKISFFVITSFTLMNTFEGDWALLRFGFLGGQGLREYFSLISVCKLIILDF